MTDINGTVLNRYAYDAFGNHTVREETVQNRFGFTGEICDGLTGQYYLRARFYNPVIGRFLNEDTYYGDGLNLYSYCRNNPVRYVDPSGHWCEGKEGRNASEKGSEANSPITGKGGYNGNVTSGDGFGKLANKKINVTQKGLNKVKNHISCNEFDAPENTAMINRLEQTMKSGEKITGADASFYMHELKESTLMSGGMSYEAAHKMALETYNVSPFSVYHPDVIKLNPSEWGKPWFDFWGLKQ